MSSKLYEPCPMCEHFSDCPACRGSRFIEIGLTANQLERLAAKADALDQVARLVKPLDLVQLGEAADWLDAFGHTQHSPFVRQAREAIADVALALRCVAAPLTTARRSHSQRNIIARFGSATETILTLVKRGLIGLSGFPGVLAQLEECHRIVLAMAEAPATATPPATEDRP